MAGLGVSQSIPIFGGENYDYWSIKMKTFFLSQDLWVVVERGVTTPAEGSSVAVVDKNEKQKDAKALFVLQQAVSDSIFPRLMRATTSKEAWDILQLEFQGNAKVKSIKLQGLRRELENFKMKESESAKEYCSRLIELVNQMRAYGEEVTDQRIVQKILISLTDKYDHVVAAVEESKDLTTLTITELMGSLQAHEQRVERRSEGSLENAFQSKVNVRSQKPKDSKKKGKQGEFPPCGTCRRTNHAEKDCFHKGKPQCTNCKRFGHVEKDCRVKTNQQANYTEEENEEHLFFACQATTNNAGNTWFIDSGCSNHMTADEDIFSELDKSVKTKVKMGNGELVESKGKGTVAIQTRKGTRYIKDVLLVPSLDQHLLSVGQMIQNGYSLHFEESKCRILDDKNNLEVAKIKMGCNRIFPIHWQHPRAMSAEVNHSIIWHQRFGHYNYDALRQLHQKEMINDLPLVQDQMAVCEGCMLGKHHRKSFPSETPKRHKLEEKSQKGVFLGYSTQSKGYRVYILETEKLIISRDVQFDEGAFWDWKESKISKKSVLVPITNSEPAADHGIQIEEPETPVSTPISASSEIAVAVDSSLTANKKPANWLCRRAAAVYTRNSQTFSLTWSRKENRVEHEHPSASLMALHNSSSRFELSNEYGANETALLLLYSAVTYNSSLAVDTKPERQQCSVSQNPKDINF
ncbi:hypothetical protein EZV62_017269 [Acer yangbiense]|uniref:CCHC-type domain-containing protein n=1 Tax=Acer yangbiense TaxID=1000413 RepID=A0A5C7HIG1_9ROSI|nr:hypothetical protein EZV62_017269 [Acer yangbiense]